MAFLNPGSSSSKSSSLKVVLGTHITPCEVGTIMTHLSWTEKLAKKDEVTQSKSHD